MPTIQRIITRTYTVPLKAMLSWGGRHELRQLDHVLIRAELSDGAVGIAEATPRPSIYGETQASIETIIEGQLAPQLLRQTVDQFESVAALSARTGAYQKQQYGERRAGYGAASGAGAEPRRESGDISGRFTRSGFCSVQS